MQVQKSAALGKTRHAVSDRRADRCAHRRVLRQRLCVQFRIPAGQNQSLRSFGQRGIVQRRKEHKLCAAALQHVEIVAIQEAERFVACDGNARMRRRRNRRFFRNIERRRALRKRQQRVEIERSFEQRRERVELRFEIPDLAGRQKSQMPAFDHQRVRLRHIPDRHDAERRSIVLQRVVYVLAHAVEDHARDPAVGAECEKSFDRGERRKRLPARIDDQHRRRVERFGDGIAARPIAVCREPVVIAHHAFDHGAVAPLCVRRIQTAQFVRAGKEQIERAGRYADDMLVEQRIDEVRSALECRDLFAAVFQRAQHAADDRRLAAAGRRRGKQNARTMHRPSLLRRK